MFGFISAKQTTAPRSWVNIFYTTLILVLRLRGYLLGSRLQVGGKEDVLAAFFNKIGGVNTIDHMPVLFILALRALQYLPRDSRMD